MSSHPEEVARELTMSLNGHGYHDKKHAEIEVEPFGLVRVSTEFADSVTEREEIVRRVARTGRKHGYHVHTYDFVEETVILHESR